MGYVGGGLLLAFDLLLISKPAWFGLDGADGTLPTRLALLSVALWWFVFTIPLWRRVSEPPPAIDPKGTSSDRFAAKAVADSGTDRRSASL